MGAGKKNNQLVVRTKSWYYYSPHFLATRKCVEFHFMVFTWVASVSAALFMIRSNFQSKYSKNDNTEFQNIDV